MNMQVLEARRDVSGGYKVDVTCRAFPFQEPHMADYFTPFGHLADGNPSDANDPQAFMRPDAQGEA